MIIKDSLNLQAQTITLLFKPGHYDILYSKDYLKKYKELSYYDTEFQSIFNIKSAPSTGMPLPMQKQLSAPLPQAYPSNPMPAAPAYNFAGPYSKPAYSVPSAPNPAPTASLYPTFDDFDPNFTGAPPAYNPAPFPKFDNLSINSPPQISADNGYAPPPTYEPQGGAQDPTYYQSDPYAGYPAPMPGAPIYNMPPEYNAPGYMPPHNEYSPPLKPAKEDLKKGEFQCSICYSPIQSKDLLVIGCLHKFHYACLQANQPLVCPVPNCGYALTLEEKIMKPAEVIPPGGALCIICKQIIREVKKNGASHCSKEGGKMHKECFILELGTMTEGKVLLTKAEEAAYHRLCPACHEPVTESHIKSNMPSDQFKTYKNSREARAKEEQRLIDAEKHAKIKTKCCSKELNKKEFVNVLNSMGIPNILALSGIFHYSRIQIQGSPNPWICPLCQKAFKQGTLKEIYSQDNGLVFIKKFCCACGNALKPGEPIQGMKCNHNICSNCVMAQFPCSICPKLK